MTKEAYEKFYIDRIYPYNLTRSIDNLEISDIKFESIPNKDDTYHSYNVLFILKNNDENKEKEVTNYKMSLEKEGSKWKIGMNNSLYFLHNWLLEII